jgi:hypothetical protein
MAAEGVQDIKDQEGKFSGLSYHSILASLEEKMMYGTDNSPM